MHGQRRGVRAAGPPQHRHLAKPVDVVGVKVSEKHRLDLAAREAKPLQGARPAGARVDDDDRMAGDHCDTRSRALQIGQWPAGAAQQDVQAIR